MMNIRLPAGRCRAAVLPGANQQVGMAVAVHMADGRPCYDEGARRMFAAYG